MSLLTPPSMTSRAGRPLIRMRICPESVRVWSPRTATMPRSAKKALLPVSPPLAPDLDQRDPAKPAQLVLDPPTSRSALQTASRQTWTPSSPWCSTERPGPWKWTTRAAAGWEPSCAVPAENRAGYHPQCAEPGQRISNAFSHAYPSSALSAESPATLLGPADGAAHAPPETAVAVQRNRGQPAKRCAPPSTSGFVNGGYPLDSVIALARPWWGGPPGPRGTPSSALVPLPEAEAETSARPREPAHEMLPTARA